MQTNQRSCSSPGRVATSTTTDTMNAKLNWTSTIVSIITETTLVWNGKMNCTSVLRCAMTIGVLSILSACGKTMIKPVEEGSRDQSGKYNGNWIGKTTITNSSQRHGNWLLNCKEPNSEFFLEITDGKVTLANLDNSPETYIDSEGKFRFVIDTNRNMQASISSEASVDNGNIKVFLDGRLNDEHPTGQFVLGVAQFGYNGCLSKVSYARN